MARRKRVRARERTATKEWTPVTDRQRKARELERKGREAARGAMDMPFLLLTLVLTGIGLVMLFSASFPAAYYSTGDAAYYFKRQLIFAIMGLVAMFVISRLNYQRWRGLSKFLLILSMVLLGLVLVPHVGINVNGATRWLGFGAFTFQPSEIAKLGVIVFFADSISKKREKMLTWRYGILPYVFVLGLIGVLMLLEPHLSGAILIVGTGAVMMAVGGIQAWLIGLGVGGIGAASVLFIKLVDKGIIKYNADRILLWHDPWSDASGDGYQICQSLIAIGSGGLFGVGLGRSRQKFLYLPERHNDCIFAIVCEELGLIGACVIMLIFVLLIIRGFWIALHARDRFGALLVVGITTQVALQTFLNIAVVTGLIPATGISLPFFSYGGTALALQLAEMGIVLSVSRQIPAPRNG